MRLLLDMISCPSAVPLASSKGMRDKGLALKSPVSPEPRHLSNRFSAQEEMVPAAMDVLLVPGAPAQLAESQQQPYSQPLQLSFCPLCLDVFLLNPFPRAHRARLSPV